MNFRKILIALCLFSQTAFVTADLAQDLLDQGKEQFYIHSTKGWTLVAPEKSHLYQITEVLAQKSMSSLTREEFDELATVMEQDFDNGTCYGQAMNFMLANPFYKKEIAMPTSDLEKRRILHFQAIMSLGGLVEEKYNAIYQTFDNYFTAYYPELSVPLEKWDEIDLVKEQQLAAKDPIRTKAFASFMKQLTTISHLLDFSQELQKFLGNLLAICDFKSLPEHTITTEGKTIEQVEDAILETASSIIGGPFATDAIIVVQPKDKNEIGHAILWQIAHKRIYDSANGIYEYEDLLGPILDFMFHPGIEEAAEITFLPYTWSKAS